MARKKRPEAAYEDYCEMFFNTLGDLRRDIFSADLCCFEKRRKRWIPVLSSEVYAELRSIAHDSNQFYNPAAIQDHILRLQKSYPRELLIDIPDWDGKDRLAVFAACIKAENFEPNEVEEILKDWGARMFRRLYDPMIQNRILIFKGPEGIGKDEIIEHMVGGLGQYLVPFTVQNQERDTFSLVSEALVINLSEYERVNKQDVAMLKNIITAKRFKFRAAFERKADWHTVRASFIASSNISDLLRDSGKNRRYIIIDLPEKGIEWAYPQGDSPQVLAQWKKLSSLGYRASAATEKAIARYIESQTPIDIEKETIHLYLAAFSKALDKSKYGGKMSLLSSQLNKEFQDISKLTGYSTQWIKNTLKRSGFGKHTNKGTRYFGEKVADLKLEPTEEEEQAEVTEENTRSRHVTSHTGDESQVEHEFMSPEESPGIDWEHG